MNLEVFSKHLYMYTCFKIGSPRIGRAAITVIKSMIKVLRGHSLNSLQVSNGKRTMMNVVSIWKYCKYNWLVVSMLAEHPSETLLL